MFNMKNAFFFFCFSTVIYVSESEKFLNSLVRSEDEAAKALVEIKPHEVLPLILFREAVTHISSQPTFDELMIPKGLIEVETLNGRMAKGTQFSNFSDTQTFFCPKQDSEKKCLAPKDFEESDFLECGAEQPTPVLNSVPKSDKCGFEKGNTFHDIGYDICPMDNTHNYEYDTKRIPFYEFCFNKKKGSTLFTSHIISSPLLLKSHLLLWERRVKYSITLDDEFKPSTLNKINTAKNQPWDSIYHTEKPSYKLQMLVPDTNMALALWRKTTYRNFNLEWQHENLISLWNGINESIRSYAYHPLLLKDNIKLKVHTGVININPALENKTQILNVWVRIITTVPPNHVIRPKGAVIFMNNFIRNATDDSSTIPKEIVEAIDEYCSIDEEGDFCDDELQETIDKAGSRLRCCSLSKENKKARDVLGVIPEMNIEGEIPKLRIPRLTKIKVIPDFIE